MKEKTVHKCLGNTQLCGGPERLNASTRLEEVTCRNCLRIVIRTCERNIPSLTRWIEKPPPMAKSFPERFAPDLLQAKLEAARQRLAIARNQMMLTTKALVETKKKAAQKNRK